MMKRLTLALASGITGTLLSFAGAAQAQTSLWDFATGLPCEAQGSPGAMAGCTATAGTVQNGFTSTTTTVSAKGWSNTGTGGAFVQASLTNQGTYGLGLNSGSSETSYGAHHAFDNKTTGCGSSGAVVNTNCGGTIELMAMNFTSKVSLSSVSLVSFGDTDYAIYRWDGVDTPTAFSTANTANTAGTGTLSGGWTLVKSGDADTNNTSDATNNGAFYSATQADAKVSSWWLISTYFGTTGADATGDTFKIAAVYGKVCQYSSTSSNGGLCTQGGPPLPEPASLALVGLALAGVWSSRRRRDKRV